MSRTIISYVIAGCDVTDKLHRDVEVRCCQHPVAASPFCAQCGKPMYRTERQVIPEYDGDDRLVINGKCWRVISDGRKRHFVGVVLAEVIEWKNQTAAGVEQRDDGATMDELRAALTSINLWDPGAYAIWNVLYAS